MMLNTGSKIIKYRYFRKMKKQNSEVSVSKLNQRFNFSAAERCTKSACINHWTQRQCYHLHTNYLQFHWQIKLKWCRCWVREMLLFVSYILCFNDKHVIAQSLKIYGIFFNFLWVFPSAKAPGICFKES